MKYTALLLGLVLACPSLIAKPVYKSQDNFGRTIYSDQPSDAAEKIELPKLQTYTPPPVATPTEQAPKKLEIVTPRYDITFLQPSQNQVYTHNVQDITIKIAVSPLLDKSHHLQLFLDGQPHGTATQNMTHQVQNLTRGAHTIQVVALDKNKKTISESQVVTIHQKRPIVKVMPQ